MAAGVLTLLHKRIEVGSALDANVPGQSIAHCFFPVSASIINILYNLFAGILGEERRWFKTGALGRKLREHRDRRARSIQTVSARGAEGSRS